MSHTDSFIDEVSEAVRRDRLYATFRKYGWIGILAVVLIVGGATWNEIRKANARSAAEQTGDSILAALDRGTPEARATGLADVTATGELADVVALLAAAQDLVAEDPAAAADLLRPIAQDANIPAVYSDLAAFKLVLLGDAGLPPEDRAQVLTRLAGAGAPYRALAMEQQLLDLLAAGDRSGAEEAARVLLQEPGLTRGLAQRVSQIMVALGADTAEDAG